MSDGRRGLSRPATSGTTRFVKIKGVRVPLADFARKAGVDYNLLYGRVRRGQNPMLAAQKIISSTKDREGLR